MKICFLSYNEDIHSKKWMRYFKEKGHDIEVLSVFRTGIKPLDIVLNIIPVRIRLKKIKPDILHAHYAGVNGVSGALSGFHPFFLTAQGSDILVITKSRLVKAMVRFSLKKADLITCGSHHVQENIIKLGIDPAKVKLIYFGTDIKKFFPVKKQDNQNPIVASLRNLDPIYDVQTFIKAIPLILKQIPQTKFIVGGRGPERKNLEQLARSLGVLDKIDFIGWVSQEELLKVFRKIDVYVSTSLSDGTIACTTGEAMACGLPVVISDFGDNKEWVPNQYVFPQGDFEKLAQEVISLLESKEQRVEQSLRNRKIIEQRNNYYQEMEKMEKIYEKTAYHL